MGEQRIQRATAEWTLAALARLMQGPHGAGNVQRFATAWKPASKEEAAREEMREFGYPMWVTPGSVPRKVRVNRVRGCTLCL